MNKFQSRVLYGILIAITGIFILLSSFNPSRTIQYGVAGGMFLSGAFAFISAGKSENSIIRLQYYWLQSIGMFVYGLVILYYGVTFERFITITSAFILYFGITEIIFGFALLAHKKIVSLSLIVTKMLVGFFMSVGAILIFATSFIAEKTSLLFAGILMLLSGIDFILLAQAMKKLDRSEISS